MSDEDFTAFAICAALAGCPEPMNDYGPHADYCVLCFSKPHQPGCPWVQARRLIEPYRKAS